MKMNREGKENIKEKVKIAQNDKFSDYIFLFLRNLSKKYRFRIV